MKKQSEWQPTKYVQDKEGSLMGSRDSRELAVSSRLVADLTAKWYQANIKEFAKGELLDLGCGKAPLYATYAPFVNGITLADWDNSQHKNKHLDVACDITKKLPFKDSSFETIILSDVLEHIPNPNELINEIERILRPGGVVLMNTPFFYWLHEVPFDYNRYTEHMIKKLVEDSNMTVVRIESLGGAYAVLIDIFSKLWRGRRASLIQGIMPKILVSKLHHHPRFPLSYATVFIKEDKEAGA